MGVWQLIWFIIMNFGTILKFIKEIIDLLDGDHPAAKATIKEITKSIPENKVALVDNNGSLQLIRSISKVS